MLQAEYLAAHLHRQLPCKAALVASSACCSVKACCRAECLAAPVSELLTSSTTGVSSSGAAPDTATPDIAHPSQPAGPLQALHGDIAQSSRESILRNFRADKFSVLVATDVAARGLDIPSVELVVHYDLPDQVGPAVLCCGVWKSGFVVMVSRSSRAERLLHQLVVYCDGPDSAAVLLSASGVHLTAREGELGVCMQVQ